MKSNQTVKLAFAVTPFALLLFGVVFGISKIPAGVALMVLKALAIIVIVCLIGVGALLLLLALFVLLVEWIRLSYLLLRATYKQRKNMHP